MVPRTYIPVTNLHPIHTHTELPTRGRAVRGRVRRHPRRRHEPANYQDTPCRRCFWAVFSLGAAADGLRGTLAETVQGKGKQTLARRHDF